ncbi:hypothetical protein FACS189427_09190 [Planctomycetales bacterium]|nr:hypothetical protein FACS189427_09190 [Planctomycetales bacterium]
MHNNKQLRFFCYSFCFILYFCTFLYAETLEIVLPVLSDKAGIISEEDAKKSENIFAEAVSAAKEKKRTETVRLLLQVLEINPDNKEIRRVSLFIGKIH